MSPSPDSVGPIFVVWNEIPDVFVNIISQPIRIGYAVILKKGVTGNFGLNLPKT